MQNVSEVHHRRRCVPGNDTHLEQTSRLGLFPSLIWLDHLRWCQEVVLDVLFNQSDHVGDAGWCVYDDDDDDEPCTHALFPIRFLNDRLTEIKILKFFLVPFQALSNQCCVNG